MNLFSSLRISFFLLGCVVFLVTGSCSKRNTDLPTPTQGRIQGTLTPVKSASSVTLTAADGQVTTVALDANGTFAFPNLVSGTYVLNAVPTSSYSAPNARSLSVTAGQITAVSLELARNYRIQGVMSWQLGGTGYTATVLHGQIQDNFFSLEGNTVPDASGVSRSVSVVVGLPGASNPAPFKGSGFYSLGLSDFTFGLYRYRVGLNIDQYATPNSGSSVGNVRMRHFDPDALTADGTFEFTALVTTNGTGTASPTQTITNGKFDITF